MDVASFFALMGGIILVGFLANLLFRVTRIPNVLLLMAIGVVMGPVTGWIASDLLLKFAPYFGTLALLIILFEGGLELDLITVVREAPRAAALSVIVFIISTGLVMLFGHYVMGLPTMTSLLLGAILGATSPAICIPVVQGLSVKEDIKTIIKLESALGDVLLIVSVLLVVEFELTGVQSAGDVIFRFLGSFVVAFVVALIAGSLWSRFMGWIGREPLSYMLTLGIMFLLYFVVEELHGSAAIAVLVFGLLLENMHVVADRLSGGIKKFFGIDIDVDKFALNRFVKNITEELSFLLRTFFFVFLGLLLDFGQLSWETGLYIIGLTGLIVLGRWAALQGFKRGNKRRSDGEMQVIMAMLPRGLATAVMALLPFQSGVAGTENFAFFAFGVIVLTNVFMTASVIFAERRLRGERMQISDSDEAEAAPPIVREDQGEDADDSAAERDGTAIWKAVLDTQKDAYLGEGPAAERAREERDFTAAERKLFGFPEEPEREAAPQSFTDWMARLFSVRTGDRERGYAEAFRSAKITDPLFWVQTFLAAGITILGLILDQSTIIIGGALVMPIMFPMLSAGLALAAGDIFLVLKLSFKLILFMVLAILLSAILSDILPFATVTAEIASRIRPTVVEFLVALFGGMAGAAVLSRKNRYLQFLPNAIIAVTLLPPLCVVGFGISHGFRGDIVVGGALLFTANLFANILGAMLVFMLIGMPKAAAYEFVRKLKERELQHPLNHMVFDTLRLSKIVGRTGSLRARLIVIGVFLLLIIIPLQSALNQLTGELRARQAIAEIGKMFDQKYRSTIVTTNSLIEEEKIVVKMQVATNSFFTSADIERFEERVFDRTGKPTRLDLVQSLSDIGDSETVQDMLSSDRSVEKTRKRRQFTDMVSELRSEVQSMLRSMPIPEQINIVSLNAELTLDTLSTVINFTYIAPEAFSDDAMDMVSTLIAGHLAIPRGSIKFNWIPSDYKFMVGGRDALSETQKVRMVVIDALLARFQQISATILLPGTGSPPYDPKAIAGDVRSLLRPSTDSTRVHYMRIENRSDSMQIHLRVEGYLKSR